MSNTANVTIQRSCDSSQEGGAGAADGGADTDAGGEDACVSCYCRPMWCMDCMAKWQ